MLNYLCTRTVKPPQHKMVDYYHVLVFYLFKASVFIRKREAFDIWAYWLVYCRYHLPIKIDTVPKVYFAIRFCKLRIVYEYSKIFDARFQSAIRLTSPDHRFRIESYSKVSISTDCNNTSTGIRTIFHSAYGIFCSFLYMKKVRPAVKAWKFRLALGVTLFVIYHFWYASSLLDKHVCYKGNLPDNGGIAGGGSGGNFQHALACAPGVEHRLTRINSFLENDIRVTPSL